MYTQIQENKKREQESGCVPNLKPRSYRVIISLKSKLLKQNSLAIHKKAPNLGAFIILNYFVF
jgi:hypothetical protein